MKVTRYPVGKAKNPVNTTEEAMKISKQYGHKGNEMREIKFRAWDKQSLEIPPHMYYFDFETAHQFARCGNIMQYTGLKDKHGKEIYESDIVRRVQKDIEGNIFDDFTAEVMWHKYATSFLVFPPDCDGLECGRDLHFYGYGFIEIIGNRYTNPELLEED